MNNLIALQGPVGLHGGGFPAWQSYGLCAVSKHVVQDSRLKTPFVGFQFLSKAFSGLEIEIGWVGGGEGVLLSSSLL